MVRVALPAIVLLRESDFGAATSRAGNAVRPAPRYQILAAVDGSREVEKRFLECFWFAGHESGCDQNTELSTILLPFISTDPGTVIAATKRAGVPRLLVVGGEGSLMGPVGNGNSGWTWLPGSL